MEEHEMLEYAQNRVSQRKWLYQHIVIFALGSVFLILINKILKYGAAYDWYAWVMLLWGFLLALHAIMS
ncbi:2TM domain-containing protein [Aureicoccus marinus]|uniref:2TM domain-containing protein n=1 Tax=Aureicoccus marinus TaxID=754435 RepID=UPI002936FF73|nr:2TM domain-containing protein [Aureicoccus marinus]